MIKTVKSVPSKKTNKKEIVEMMVMMIVMMKQKLIILLTIITMIPQQAAVMIYEGVAAVPISVTMAQMIMKRVKKISYYQSLNQWRTNSGKWHKVLPGVPKDYVSILSSTVALVLHYTNQKLKYK